MSQERAEEEEDQMTDSTRTMYPIEVARTLLTDLMAYTKTLDLPPTHQGRFCGNWWQHHEQWEAQTEEARQRKLLNLGKSDQQVMKEIFQILVEFPRFASKKYENYSKESIFPLWYLVLQGGNLDMVKQVYQMYPHALEEPLVRQETERIGAINGMSFGFTIQTWTLLNAACSTSSWRIHATDEVVLFLARKGPRSALSNGSFRRPPFLTRLFPQPNPNTGQVYRASLQLIQELVPPNEWTNMETINKLFNEGYGADVLNYAVDQMMMAKQQDSNNHQEEAMTLKLSQSSWQQNPGCLLNTDRARVLERLFPIVTSFHCKPPKWTLDGFLHTCQSLAEPQSQVQDLTLKLHQDRFVDGGDQGDITSALETLFATNASIQNLQLQVQEPYLQAVANGLAQHGRTRVNKLRLVVEMLNRNGSAASRPMIDITGPIQSLLKNHGLKSLCINGPSSTYQLDLSTICIALKGDTTLESLELNTVPNDSDVDQFVELLKANATLRQLVVHDSGTGTDYTGFTLCGPKEISYLSNHPWCGRIHCLERAEEMIYYMRLNRSGRALVRKDTTTLTQFLQLVQQPLRQSTSKSELDGFNVLFGLLLEAAPRLVLEGLSPSS